MTPDGAAPRGIAPGEAAATPPFARRLGRTEVAAIVTMSNRARALRAAGHDVLMLTIGEPDFATPPHAIAAAHAAALRGETKYPPQDGTLALKQAVIRKFAREDGLHFTPDQIIIGNGGKQVIFDALMATVEEGDEVVIPTPYWSAYALMTRLAGGTPVFVACAQTNGFRPRPEDLDAAITPATRWLFLNSPNNPTGAVLGRADLEAIAAVVRRHPHVWVLCDDMYSRLRFDGADPSIQAATGIQAGGGTLAAVAPDLAHRVLTVAGVSKTYAMTGWRIGFGGGCTRLIAAMANMQGQATAGVSSVGQAAAVAALDGPQDGVAIMVDAYRRRRDAVVAALDRIAGVSCAVPQGAFYVFPSIAGCLGRVTPAGRRIDTDTDFATALLEEAHVAVVAGSAFGMSPHLRISTASDDATLSRACERLAGFVASLV